MKLWLIKRIDNLVDFDEFVGAVICAASEQAAWETPIGGSESAVSMAADRGWQFASAELGEADMRVRPGVILVSRTSA